MLTVYYDPAYTAAGHAFATTRKACWVADSLLEDPIPGVRLEAPAPLAEDDLLAVHDAEYVAAVRTGSPRRLAGSQGFAWDAALWPMVLSSNGGVVVAARRAVAEGVSGSLSSGLHHARRSMGSGFCTFNGLAIAARAALAWGAGNVLILDLDAHCGGGTHELVASNSQIWHTDVSVDRYDGYQPSERATLDVVGNAEDYLPVVERRLSQLTGRAFGLCLYNAGMDPHQDCPIGGLSGIDEDLLRKREELVFGWCRTNGVPVAFVLAGGYIQEPKMSPLRLVGLHRLTIAAAKL